jgi:AcrR family transcriptional regulator
MPIRFPRSLSLPVVVAAQQPANRTAITVRCRYDATSLSTVFAMTNQQPEQRAPSQRGPSQRGPSQRGQSQRAPSIWTRPERAARGPSPEHTRAEIAAAGISIADTQGLSAVTMRSVASAIGTAPASLYRYLLTRDELVELMADHVYGEFSHDEPATGDPIEDLLHIAREGRGVYQRHPWLLDVAGTENMLGPNAIAFIERTLAALGPAKLSGPARLETVGLFSGALRLIAQTELGQLQAGQDAAEWQAAIAAYLLPIAADGKHPHLAAALADQPADVGSPPSETLFDRAMPRILAGLLANPARPGSPSSLNG